MISEYGGFCNVIITPSFLFTFAYKPFLWFIYFSVFLFLPLLLSDLPMLYHDVIIIPLIRFSFLYHSYSYYCYYYHYHYCYYYSFQFLSYAYSFTSFSNLTSVICNMWCSCVVERMGLCSWRWRPCRGRFLRWPTDHTSGRHISNSFIIHVIYFIISIILFTPFFLFSFLASPLLHYLFHLFYLFYIYHLFHFLVARKSFIII